MNKVAKLNVKEKLNYWTILRINMRGSTLFPKHSKISLIWCGFGPRILISYVPVGTHRNISPWRYCLLREKFSSSHLFLKYANLNRTLRLKESIYQYNRHLCCGATYGFAQGRICFEKCSEITKIQKQGFTCYWNDAEKGSELKLAKVCLTWTVTSPQTVIFLQYRFNNKFQTNTSFHIAVDVNFRTLFLDDLVAHFHVDIQLDSEAWRK